MEKTIVEKRINMNNNESMIVHGVYYSEQENGYYWLTSTRSGFCKKLTTAMKKVGR